ncbi:MAG: alpha/beta fold hydrolase [Thalassobaculum sp.]|uniref:YheT family hydrolase n=1 Tax=Thalassobaculum sp. TaxID=2022740 RepID=UPI0032ED2E64
MPSDDVAKDFWPLRPERPGGRPADRGLPPVAPGFPEFRPRWPWWGSDLQTLRDVLVPAADPHDPASATLLQFEMPDGTGDRLTAVLERPRHPVAGRPLAVLVHGLTGCADSRYLLRAAGRLLDAGFPVLRLNLRGAGACRSLCREQYHSGRSEDLDAVLQRLPDGLTADGLVLVGWSLGANLLLKGLSEFGAAHPIRAAVAVSAPIDLAAAAERIRSPRNRLYHRWLLRRMKLDAAAAPEPVSGDLLAALRSVRDIVDFDQRITAPRNGYDSAADYYARCSATGFLADIPVPTLVLHALDDPWIPAAAYRGYDWDANRNLIPLLPAQGGHVGFHAPGGRVWSDDCMLGFLEAACDGAVSRP